MRCRSTNPRELTRVVDLTLALGTRTKLMIGATRIPVAVLSVLLSFGFSACAHTAAPNDTEESGTAGSSSTDAGDSGADTVDSGVEQIDAATSCSDLYTLARRQLDEAAACDVSGPPGQCTGTVAATCGCPVAVDSQSSDATLSYLNTLSVIQAKMCVVKCPAQFCEPTNGSQCVAQIGGDAGVCVHH
jgi:hypothetical protein